MTMLTDYGCDDWPALPPLSTLEGRVHHCDAFDLLRALPDASVNLVLTDPPYNGVKADAWDNQWASDDDYIAWVGELVREFRRVLTPNGSLYLFASPRMAARVEVEVSRWMNVINHITWRKLSSWAEGSDKEALRGFFPSSERVIFAEQPRADAIASGEAGYHETYDEAKRLLKVGIVADYLADEFNRAGVSRKEIAALFPSRTGGLTGCVSNWLLGYNLPTEDQYHKMRDYLNDRAAKSDFLRQQYDDLRQQYDDLRQQYDDLRQQYDDLRRPFNSRADLPYTDVWEYRTVNTYPGKHPCEKPLQMLLDVIEISSRPGDLVLDVFGGSGATFDAARRLGRRWVGCDADAHWVRYARNRVSLPYARSLFDAA